ncbi:MAG: hypothetical protein LLG02_03880 [Pelosinus sp.]|nr:hypothetical protein [Pelosinus sp.]
MKSKILGFSFLLVMFISFLLSQTMVCIKVGNKLLVKIGTISYFTINYIEYSMIFLLLIIIFIAGFWGAKHYLTDSHPGLIQNIGFIFILLILFSPIIQVYTNYMLLFFSRDINAVEYCAAKSICTYSLNKDKGNIDATYRITLINHSKDSISFNMKVQTPPSCGYSIIEVKEVSGKEKLKTFSLSPKESKTWLFTISLKSSNAIPSQGTINRPAIILFNNSRVMVPWSGTPPKDL